MLSDKELKSYAIKSGKNIKIVKSMFDKATKEANSLGKGKDQKFIIELFKDLIDLDESATNRIAIQFTKSNYFNFDEFIEALISQDIPQEGRPEIPIKKNIEDEIEEEQLINRNDTEDIIDTDKKDDIIYAGCKKKK